MNNLFTVRYLRKNVVNLKKNRGVFVYSFKKSLHWIDHTRRSGLGETDFCFFFRKIRLDASLRPISTNDAEATQIT